MAQESRRHSPAAITITRQGSNHDSPLSVASWTATGFTIDRDNSIDVASFFHYVVIGRTP